MYYFVVKFEYVYGCVREIIRIVFNVVFDLYFFFLLVLMGVYLGK